MTTTTIRPEHGELTITHPDGTPQTVIDRDSELTLAVYKAALGRGCTDFLLKCRRIRRLFLIWQKEVGPPPRTWPKAGIKIRRHRKPKVLVMVGWRSTMYIISAVW